MNSYYGAEVKVGMTAAAAPAMWTDHNGRLWKTPTIKRRLKFKIPGHAALRAFVFFRDQFTCCYCGVKATVPDEPYTGRHAVSVPGRWCLVMDHVIARVNGGAHHPGNLLTACNTCNAVKACVEDIPRRQALQPQMEQETVEDS